MEKKDKMPAGQTEETTVALPETPASKSKKARRKKHRLYKHVDVNNGEKSFAAGLNIYKIIWVFVLGCIIGVVVETLFVYILTGEWMRRSGMLYGPFNQIYGFGAVLFTMCLYRYRHKNGLFIFLASSVLGLAFEFISSWVQEVFFGSKSWDYSEWNLNLAGRINPLYGVAWGVMGLLFLTHFWPWISEMIERIPNKFGRVLTIAVAVALTLNLTLSAAAVFRQKERLAGTAPNNFVGRLLDNWYPDDYMAKKYPAMKFKEQPPAETPPPEGAPSESEGQPVPQTAPL